MMPLHTRGGTGIYKGTKLLKLEDHWRSWETRRDTERYKVTEMETQIQMQGTYGNIKKEDEILCKDTKTHCRSPKEGKHKKQ